MVSANADFLSGYVTPPAPTAPTAPTTLPPMDWVVPAPAPPAVRPDPRTAEPVAEFESAEFERTHGRLPTYQERLLIRAVPAITRQLGRPPTRVELLQYASRRDTAPQETQQFEVTSDNAAAGPAGTGAPGA